MKRVLLIQASHAAAMLVILATFIVGATLGSDQKETQEITWTSSQIGNK